MIQYIILGVTFGFAAAVQPGPLLAYLVNRSLTTGWKNTIIASFAPLLSDGPIIVLILFLLNQMTPFFIKVLQVSGGVYLLYLAAMAFKSFRNYDGNKLSNPQSKQQTLIKAVFVNLLNPNPYLGWSLVMGPILIKGWNENPINGIALLISFYTAIVISLSALVFLFSNAGNLGVKINRILIGISVIALGCFGVYQLWLGLGTYLI